jgi:hypothetical protein
MSLCILEHGALPLGWPTPQIKLRRGGNVYQHGGFKYPNRQHDLVNAVPATFRASTYLTGVFLGADCLLLLVGGWLAGRMNTKNSVQYLA